MFASPPLIDRCSSRLRAFCLPGFNHFHVDGGETSCRRGHNLALYRDARTRDLPIRLLGIQLARLRLDAVLLPLFDAGGRRGAAVDRVRDRFGYDSLHLATTIGRFRRG